MLMNRPLIYFLGFIVFLTLFYFLSPILTPFFIAALLAYLGDPLVCRLTQWRMPRLAAALLVFLVFAFAMIALLFLLIPLLERQILMLLNQLPQMFSWVSNTVLPWLSEHFGIQDEFNFKSLQQLLAKNWQQAGNFATVVLRVLTHSGYSIFLFSLNFILVPIVTFYFLRDWDRVIQGLHRLLPLRLEPVIVKLARECNDMISAFFRGQLLLMLSLAIYYSVALSLIKLSYALLFGVIIGLIAIVPYLGFSLGIILAAITAYIEFHQWTQVMYVGIIFLIGHVLENYVLSPWLVGDRIGLHPVAVIFAILAGGQIYGFIGVLFALPVAAIIMVLLRFVKERYLASSLYQD